MAGKPSKKNNEELVFVALGGLGEIGMNVYLYGFGPEEERQWLMVDLGITFPGPQDVGVDVVLPDLRFIAEERGSLAGIVITHAHEDHVGAVINLWPQLGAKIYGTSFTLGMLRAKLAEFGGGLALPLNEVALNGQIEVGPFDVEFVQMAHSIPEPSALIIRTPAGTAFHSADWKIDKTPVVGGPMDQERLVALGKDGLHALICDSTNAMREGTSPSERDVAASLAEITKRAKRCVAVTTFSSNVGRIKAVAEAAQAAGRRLIVAGRALHRVIGVAVETGHLPDDFEFFDQQSFNEFDRDEMVVLCTGSQGEPRAAIARIGDGEHPDIRLSRGDLVIFSSRNIPGNEKAIARVQNNLVKMGCEVLTDSDALVHVTGHPRRDELDQIYKWLRPDVAVPMHGEARHLAAHAKLAKANGVPHVCMAFNGDVVRLAPSPAKVVDQVPTGRQFRDGSLVVPSEEGPARERRKLSQVGIAVVALALSQRGELMADPELELDGVPEAGAGGEEMYDLVLDSVEETLATIPAKRRKDIELVREAVRRSVRSKIAAEWGKRPIVKVLVSVVQS